jgi:hypothetical protein
LLTKYPHYSGRSKSGRPLIHLIAPGSSHGLSDTEGIDKTASGEHLPGVIELIESLQAQPGRVYLVNSALGAGEYVGFNLRGDWFGEAGLRHAPPEFEDIPVWDIDARRKAANSVESVKGWGQLAWGYPTFYNAHRFRHHVNKDPNKAYGFILGAFWDDRMKRVILVSELIENMCRKLGAGHIYERIKSGDFPDSSMGSKVPYDRCSICGNTARSPSNYCVHVARGTMPPYGMKALLPDGRICGVYNDYPRFFDDSFVFIGAERSAKVMSNVTEQVKGNNPYTQTIYPFVRPMGKVASIDEVEEEVEEQATMLMPDFVLEEKLTRALSLIPASTALEREGLRYFMQERLAQQRIAKGTMSSAEFEMWKQLSRNLFLRQYGVAPENLSYLQNLFNTRADQVLAGGMSKAADMPKWAEMLKRIPAPSPRQLSIVREQEETLPELDREVLDRLSEDTGPSIRAAARLGVVLRPREFQYLLMKKLHPDRANSLYERGEVFRPTPLRQNVSGFDAASFVPKAVMQRVIESLAPILESRSFAPSAVRLRITRVSEMPKLSSFKEIDGLEEISNLYNSYRLGLIERSPDWEAVRVEYVPSSSIEGDVKTAEDSVSLSNLLLHVAYWTGLGLGLNQPEEGSPPEDTDNHPTNNYLNGESHHVTP